MAEIKWIYNQVEQINAVKIAEKSGISVFLAKLLLSRGYDSEEKIKDCLYGWKESEYDPFLLKDMGKAVDEIKMVISNKEKITIFGDYDCDGITATAILVDFLKSIGADVNYYIPDRITEGYGMSILALDVILNRGTKLVITVDCGISAKKEVDYVNSCGCSIIITDHHQCPPELPAAKAVVNPHREDCEYPFKMLAGVGVAYKLIQALCKEFGLGNVYYKYVELVSLGTIADVVSITDENRNIVSEGLEKITKTSNLGLFELLKLSQIDKYKITSYSFSFGLAPRINAAGRMGNAEIALQLILADQYELAKELAYLLEVSNKQRQMVEIDNLNIVLDIIENDERILKRNVIVVSSSKLYSGVVGIVAAKIVEQYNKPCILLVEEKGKDGEIIARGSARSIKGINIFEMFTKCKDVLLEYGGHTLAAGVSLEVKNIELLAERLNSMVIDMDVKELFVKLINADIMIDANDITVANIESLKLLEPYGNGNETPSFVLNNVYIDTAKQLGNNNRHLKLSLHKDGMLLNAIAFNMGNKHGEIYPGDRYNIMFTLENNEWNNKKVPQLKIIELMKVGYVSE